MQIKQLEVNSREDIDRSAVNNVSETEVSNTVTPDKKPRYAALDTLRGITLISMILYHGLWDVVYMFGVDMPWYESRGAYIWQQSICWTFILLSGFCWSFGSKKLKRGILVVLCSLLISLVTIVLMPDSRILFGVLSLIGTSMLVLIPLDKWLRRWNPYLAGGVCFFLFLITKKAGSGVLCIFGVELLTIPKILYGNLFTAYLGFPADSFWSSDYFPVIPWLFLYMTGYFLYQIFKRKDWLLSLTGPTIKPLNFLGRNSLIIYMVHQPVVYGALYVWFHFANCLW